MKKAESATTMPMEKMTIEGRPVAYDDTDVLKTVVLMTDGQHDRSYRIQDWAYNSESEYAHWNRYNLFSATTP